MRKQGFKLYNLSAARTARAALPLPFLNSWPGQTVRGQPYWGDLLYLRDPVDTGFSRHWNFNPDPVKLLKLICLFELFGLPDCAAELALARREDIAPLVDVTWLLDALTPPLMGKTVSYEEYVATFLAEPESFFPGKGLGQASEGSYAAYESGLAKLAERVARID